jgi:hypothetical protein
MTLEKRGKEMLDITKNTASGTLWNLFNLFNRSSSKTGPYSILKGLSKSLEKEAARQLKQIESAVHSVNLTEALHMSVDNLNNIALMIRNALRNQESLTVEASLKLLDTGTENTKSILLTDPVPQSDQALEIMLRTLNFLFSAKQIIKREHLLITPPIEIRNSNDNSPSELKSTLGTGMTEMVISSMLLYQLHHSLFPAERMLVGAGRKNGQLIEIEGVFDVTGKSSNGYVKADANRLARALIAMGETERYFALWVHSHPGQGRNMTCPSSVDHAQEADWLKDYSSDLINAIVVEDRYIRFWGRAMEEGRVTVKISGPGIIKEPEPDLYRLEF